MEKSQSYTANLLAIELWLLLYSSGGVGVVVFGLCSLETYDFSSLDSGRYPENVEQLVRASIETGTLEIRA